MTAVVQWHSLTPCSAPNAEPGRQDIWLEEQEQERQSAAVRALASWSLLEQRPLQQQQRLRVRSALLSSKLCACRYVKTLETSLEAAQRKKMGTDAKVAKKARPCSAPLAYSQPADCFAICPNGMSCLAACQDSALTTLSSLPPLQGAGFTRAADIAMPEACGCADSAGAWGRHRTRRTGRRSGRRSWMSYSRRRSSSPRCPLVRPAFCEITVQS